MENVINKAVPVNNTVFTFTDSDGEIFARFRIDPTDPRLLKRAAKIGDDFYQISKSEITMEQKEERIEQAFCDFLGYDCKAELFGSVAAVSEMQDGTCFVVHVLDALLNYLGPEIRRRRKERISKYTARYTKKGGE